MNGHFVPKADYLAQIALSSKSSPQARLGQTPKTSTVVKPPVIQGVAWVFPSQGVEIHGTDFTEHYCPSANSSCRNTTPHVIVNGVGSASVPQGASATLATQIQTSGCYNFVVQRKVPVPAGNNQFTEGPGPLSAPYQEFVFAPNRVRIDAVQPQIASLDQPLSYQIIGAIQDPNGVSRGLGQAGAALKVMAIAAGGQHLADGTQGRTIPSNQIQVASANALLVQDEMVQGDTIHTILFPDPRYGDVQSNNVTATMPRRLVIQQVTPSGSGYVITGPNFGSDVNQLRLIENNTAVPQGHLSLSVLTGINTNTIQLTVTNSTASGPTAIWLSTLVPGIGQRRVTVTLPPHQ